MNDLNLEGLVDALRFLREGQYHAAAREMEHVLEAEAEEATPSDADAISAAVYDEVYPGEGE